jgi:hypothetical protein
VDIRSVLKYALGALAAAAVLLSLGAASAAAPRADDLTQVSQDGIVDGLALHRSEVQPSLAADTTGSDKTLVGAFEVGRIFNGGSSAIGWATSKANGNGWHDGLLPLTVGSNVSSTPAGVVWRAADPSAARDADHGAWLVSATGLTGTGGSLGLFVDSSTNANSWSGPVVPHAAATGDAPDNGSLTCDNWPSSKGYGTCYLAYDNTASSPANQLEVVTSTDGGATWSAPVSTPDGSTGTGAVALVQPPPPSAALGSVCGRLVVSYAGSTASNGGVFSFTSDDCGATLSAHTQVLPNMTTTHTVAQTVRTGLVVSASMDGAGGIYLAWQTRSFRTAQTTLSTAANAGDTNVKVASVTGMTAGNTLTIDPTGSNPETVTISTVGTAGAGGTGVTFTPALASAHASGAFVTVNGVASTSTAAPNDIALSVMPGPTDAAPTPGFGAPTRIPIESDTGALTDTVDHFIPAIAADPSSSGSSARLALFYYFYPLAACNYVDPPDNSCSPQVGYVSSDDGGATWSDPQALSPGPPSLGVYARTLALGGTGNGGPDLGSVLAALVVPNGKLSGDAIGMFPVGIAVNGLDESMYVPNNGLQIGGGA